MTHEKSPKQAQDIICVEHVETSPPRDYAGGAPAVVSSLKHALSHMGPARSALTLLRVNQTHGFDCPGCAWPDPKHRAAVEFCENGAKAVADEATLARVTPDFFARNSIRWLAQQDDHWLNQRGRLTHPMIKRPGQSHYEPLSWDEAFATIAAKLNALDHPDQAVFYTSGRTSNEAAFLYQLFVRQFGTNNLPDCSNMCHESSGTGLKESIGVGKGTVSLEDFERAEVILVIGQNPGTNHPRMLTALQAAKRKGATIISMNPLREAALIRFKHPQEIGGLLGDGTPLTDIFLQVRIGGDIAALKGFIKALLLIDERQPGFGVDHSFIQQHTLGFEQLRCDALDTPWEHICDASGLSRAQIERVAMQLAGRSRIIACWAMGLTQHVHGVANIQQVTNLLLMRGAFGEPGAGACPVRGHSNVQGDRTMGIYEKMPDAFLDKLGQEFGFDPPRAHGLDTVGAIEAMRDGHARVFFGLGGNFLSASPDTHVTARALSRCDLTVHVSTKLNRAHLTPGDTALILPCLGRTERDVQHGRPQLVSVEDSMSEVHASQGRLNPASKHLQSEPWIIARLAQATLNARSKTDWMRLVSDYDLIREHIARVIPGFHDFNRRLRQPGGFVLPNAVRDSLTFETTTGKANFITHPIPAPLAPPDKYVMMTIRSHDQYNTTIYGLDDRYRGIHQARRVVLMSPEDIAREQLVEGQLVTLTSHYEGKERVSHGWAVVPYEIPSRQVATYFPEANELVPLEQRAHKSRTPASKGVCVSIKPGPAYDGP